MDIVGFSSEMRGIKNGHSWVQLGGERDEEWT